MALACLAAVAAAVRPAAALDPGKAFHQYRLDVWQSKEGLPQGSVIAMIQTSDGYLWLGGYEGLDRFDGVRFTSFTRANTPALRDNNVFALAESTDRSLWIGTDGGGLTRLANGRFTAYTTAEGLVDDRVVCLLASRDGSVWVGTKGGLSRFDGERFMTYTTRDGLPNDYVAYLAEDHGGDLWIGTEGGLARLQNDILSTYSTRDGLAGDDIAALAVDREGTLWIGSYGADLTRYRDGVFTRLTWEGAAAKDAVSFLEDRDGNLWIGTYGNGLLRLRDGRLTTHGLSDGLTSDLVWALVEDREGSVWMGTEGGGLLGLKDTPLVPFTARDGLPHERILAVYEDGEGVLWLGTDSDGLVKADDGTFTSYTVRDGLASDIVHAVHRRRDGSLWIGTASGVNQLRRGRLTSDFATEIGPSVPVRALLEDRRGRMWIATDGRGLVAIEGASVTTYSTADGLPGDGLRVLAEDRHGALWIGADGGLARLRDGKVTTYPELDGAFVRAIHEDPEGTLWVGTRGGGLTRIRDGEARTFTTRDGLHHDVIYQILEDDRRNLWMSCNKGIFRLAREELEALARGDISSVRSTAYGTAEGMKTPDCSGGSQPAGWKTRDGKLWFPTYQGLVVIDPAHLETNALAPPVYVERVLANGIPVAAVEPGGPLALPPDKRELELHFTALSFFAPEKVRFKYQLTGYDAGWIDAGSRRTAYYANMPPGSYTFRVIAANNDGVWNETGAELAITLAPYFYETPWFSAAGVALLLLLGYGGYALQTRRIRARNRELEALNAELEQKNEELELRNAEMERFTYTVSHDLKTPLVTIKGFLGLLQRDAAAVATDPAAAERMEQDAAQISSAADKMALLLDDLLELSRVGRLMNPPETVALSELAREAAGLVAGPIAARGVAVEIDPRLPAVFGDRRRLVEVYQNLLANAVAYMGDQASPRVEVGVRREGEEEVLLVRDNGMGIDPRYHEKVFELFERLDPESEGTGVGLALVKRIVEVHGGRIWVESGGRGRGSTFCFTLPPGGEKRGAPDRRESA